MNVEQLISYCKSMNGAEKTYPFGESPICIKVCGKIFAEIYPNPLDYKITLKCEPELARFYREQYPDSITRGYHCPPVQQPYRNTVRIDKVEECFLLDMIDHSYQQVVNGLSKKSRMELLRAVTREELEKRGALLFTNIQEGFDKYHWEILSGNENELKQKLEKLREKSGNQKAYTDFHYGSLKKEEKENVWNMLSDRGRHLLEPYKFLSKMVYLPLTDELFELTLELNCKEILFCTYYFLGESVTVWGNYEMKFPAFYKENH